MLFKTLTEFRAYYDINADTNFETVARHIKEAEQAHIIPLISQAFYNEIHTAYQANTLSAEQALLLPYLQDALAYYTMSIALPFFFSNVGNAGVTQNFNELAERATAQAFTLRQTRTQRGADTKADRLLAYLESKKAIFTTWAASSAYTQTKNLFINSATELSQYISHFDDSRRNFLKIKSHLKELETSQIMLCISETYFNELKAQLLAGTLTADNQIIIDKIKPALACFAFSEAINELTAELTAEGIISFPSFDRIESKGMQVAQEKIDKIATLYGERAKFHINKLKEYLDYSPIEKYATYKASSIYTAPPEAEAESNYDNSKGAIFAV